MEWWRRINLSKRIVGHVVLLELVTLIIGGTAIWYASGFQKTVDGLIGQNIKALQASQEMENALLNQKGFVTYYFLDGDPKWLEELSRYRDVFRKWLETARRVNRAPSHASLLERIGEQYRDYIRNKDRVIDLYRNGKREEGERLHWEVRSQFFELNRLCRSYGRLNEEEIQRLRESTGRKAAQVSSFVVAALIVSVVLGVVLAFLLIVQVIKPIRSLAAMAPRCEEPDKTADGRDKPANEVTTLSYRVRGIMADMDRARSELEQSREMLMYSEKMALVGKLATEVAHSIRSPMTSINMRLFSLQRKLELTENQKEDFAVVAEEMGRLDNIVRNFLEFSRPPKLRKNRIDLCGVVDMTLELLRYRLERHGVTMVRERPRAPLLVEADPELMKEVFVNLIVNACEAMGEEGRIFIQETEAVTDWCGRAVTVQVRDTGPGIPEEARHQILEPFHTTKTQGTGLGLFISARIIQEHGGRLDLISEEGWGAAFIVTLPAVEEGQNE